MPIELRIVRQLATDVARQEDPEVRVIGVTTAEGGREHAEIVLARDHAGKTSRFVVRVNREGDEAKTRADLRKGMRDETTHAASAYR
jgi:hypothetical protein